MAISLTGASTFAAQTCTSFLSLFNTMGQFRSLAHSVNFQGQQIQHWRDSMILVDSTRSGKRIPDALSKTVPIWCAVINRAMVLLNPDLPQVNERWDSSLYTAPGAVSAQEHHQIETKLDGWARALAV